jgi:hypothetical protein
MQKSWSGRLLAAAAAVCLYAPAALAQKPAAAPGPWAKVPPLPTACYSGQDDYLAKNTAAFDAVQQAHYAQNDANEAVQQKANAALNENPMAAMQAMQQAMMDDPQNAQKIMEQMVKQGEQAQTEVPQLYEKEQKFKAESQTLTKQYQAALAKAMGPSNALWAALKKKHGFTDNTPIGDCTDDWTNEECHAVLKAWDNGYAATCAQWWTATGPFHAYLKRYKDFLVQERIPSEKKFSDEPKLQQFQQLNVPATGWRTTADYKATEDYLTMARSIFEQRETAPRCRPETYCQ